MELFNVNTGEYLELGKNWLFGGNYIMVSTSGLSDFTNSIEWDVICKQHNFSRHWILDCEDKNLIEFCKKTNAIAYGGGYVLINTFVCKPFNQSCENRIVKDCDVFINTKYTGLCYNSIKKALLLNTKELCHKKIPMHDGIESWFIEDMCSKDAYKDFFYPNMPDLSIEVAKIKEDPRPIFDARQTVGISKSELKKMKVGVNKWSDNDIIESYLERIAPTGYTKIGNILEEYSKAIRKLPNRLKELCEVLKIEVPVIE